LSAGETFGPTVRRLPVGMAPSDSRVLVAAGFAPCETAA
jgi:hypothetical protein